MLITFLAITMSSLKSPFFTHPNNISCVRIYQCFLNLCNIKCTPSIIDYLDLPLPWNVVQYNYDNPLNVRIGRYNCNQPLNWVKFNQAGGCEIHSTYWGWIPMHVLHIQLLMSVIQYCYFDIQQIEEKCEYTNQISNYMVLFVSPWRTWVTQELAGDDVQSLWRNTSFLMFPEGITT